MSASLSGNEVTKEIIEEDNAGYLLQRFIFKHREHAAKKLVDKLKVMVEKGD